MSHNPDMNAERKSDDSIVPEKSANEGADLSELEERMEGRGSTKENADHDDRPRTQSRTSCLYNGLDRVRERARQDKEIRFSSLLHHADKARFTKAFKRLKPGASTGIDKTTKNQYKSELEKNLTDLHARIHRGSFRATPSRRTYIPKSDGTKRPIGVASLEDKIAQRVIADILEAIYEEDFKGFSHGFRPGRKPHDALDALYMGIKIKKISWVLDADIRGFFDSINHEWMVKFLEHRIADRRVIRLIKKWLKVGVMEEGRVKESTEGTPQGAVLSPVLANIYLHYAFDLWADKWRQDKAKGDVIIVRYADDFVLGFQHRQEAEQFLGELKARLAKFELTLHPDKTRLIEFGRFAAQNRTDRGEGKPETFDFLGVTHYCGKTRKTGRFKVGRKTIKKRLRGKLKQVRFELMKRRHHAVAETGQWVRSVMTGYYNYHAFPGNFGTLATFERQVLLHWLQSLRRRSQRDRMNWERFKKIFEAWLPKRRIIHPYPEERFNARIRGRSRMR